MTLFIGQEAPDFTALALMPDNKVEEAFSFRAHIADRIGILIFYAMDFSYVSPTELLALGNRYDRFKAANARVVVVSTDSHLSHLRWKSQPPARGGIGDLPFPMVADMTRRVATGYDVLINDGVAAHASFVIDRQGFVRHQSVNDFPLGRDMDHLLSVAEGLQYHQRTGHLCPAGWKIGQESIPPTAPEAADYLARHTATL